MLLLLDIGNTNTHLGIANGRRIIKHANIPTRTWTSASGPRLLKKFLKPRHKAITGSVLCSVVPAATGLVRNRVRKLYGVSPLVLSPATLRGVGIKYPKPETIGADRLANAAAAKKRFGSPVVVVDFGTAVTFDVIDAAGFYVGGIIAPGLAAMTDYLHERTALLPRIKIREISTVIGKSTEQAMLTGAVHGYRGLIRGLLSELKAELRTRRLPVVATGGYAKLMASGLPEITAVDPLLTLEGLRLMWEEQGASAHRASGEAENLTVKSKNQN
jgi:type III pantothenate kinase